MSDKEILSDDQPSGDGDGSGEMVSMAQLKDAVAAAVDQTVEKFGPIIKDAAAEQGKRTRQSQRDTIKDTVGSTVETALQDLGLSTASPSSEDDGSPEEPARQSEDQDEELPSPTDGLAAEMHAILKERGLTGKEPEIAEWISENKGEAWYKTGASFEEMADRIQSRASDAPIGSGKGKGVSEDLVREYTDAMNDIVSRKAKGEIRHTDARSEREAVRTKYRELGVEIDQIGFGGQGTLHKQNEYSPLN